MSLNVCSNFCTASCFEEHVIFMALHRWDAVPDQSLKLLCWKKLPHMEKFLTTFVLSFRGTTAAQMEDISNRCAKI